MYKAVITHRHKRDVRHAGDYLVLTIGTGAPMQEKLSRTRFIKHAGSKDLAEEELDIEEQQTNRKTEV